MVERKVSGYLPRKHQDVLHQSLTRFNVIVAHRRFGKSVFCVNELIDQALRNDLRDPKYAYIAPTYAQAKRIIWEELKKYTESYPYRDINEADLRMFLHRPDRGDKITIWLLSAEKPDNIRGIYLDGVILDEFAQCDPTVFSEVVRPTLSDRMGWAIFIGTPKGRNHFFDRYEFAKKDPAWFASVYRADETGIINPEELELARREMGDDEFAQEYLCSFSAALKGAYYGKEMDAAEKEERITKVPYDTSVPVFTAWDLGIGDSTCIWFFQYVGREIHFIDYEEISGASLKDIAKELTTGHRSNYLYGKDFLPHDAKARELQTGKSRQQALRELLGRNPIVLPRGAVDDGIQASRQMIAKSWFDELKCERGINALRNYERKYNSKLAMFENRPLHNWASHGADALRTAAMADNPRMNASVLGRQNLPREADDMDYDILGG